jgi:hypothetical protein
MELGVPLSLIYWGNSDKPDAMPGMNGTYPSGKAARPPAGRQRQTILP